MTRHANNPPSKSRPPRLRRLLRSCAVFLLLGAAGNVVVAYALGLFEDVSQCRVETASAWSGRHQWTVTRWQRPGAAYVLSVREPGADWSPGQAIGPPDTPTGGDQVTAWASATADGQREWIKLEYAEPVVPKSVRVYEIYSTGAVDKVTVFDPQGNEVEAWSGVDPTPRGGKIATSEIPLKPLGFATRSVKLYIDSPAVPNWNEIDAVGLVDAQDQVHWAVAAEASSTYASSRGGMSVAGGGPAALVPEWSGLWDEGSNFTARRINREQRAIEARGWPMLSLWGRVPSGKLNGPAPSAASLTTPGVPGGGAAMSFYASGILLSASPPPPQSGPVAGEPPLLIHPIWRGFAVNSLLYAVVLAGLYWAMMVPRRFVREVGRIRRGCCVACGYDLGFDFAPGCPECGWRRGGGMTNDQAPMTKTESTRSC